MSAVFIAIEGLDGSGGTTQTRLLAEWFRNQGHQDVVTTNEPSTGPVGRFIRTTLNPKHEASIIGDAVLPYLFAGDRRDHLDREIIPALQRGAAVITDRYYHGHDYRGREIRLLFLNEYQFCNRCRRWQLIR